MLKDGGQILVLLGYFVHFGQLVSSRDPGAKRLSWHLRLPRSRLTSLR